MLRPAMLSQMLQLSNTAKFAAKNIGNAIKIKGAQRKLGAFFCFGNIIILNTKRSGNSILIDRWIILTLINTELMGTKEAFHQLIDKIKHKNVLKGYLELIQRLSSHEESKLWNELSKEQQEELLIAYEESFDNENIIPHNEVRNQHDKWLGNI
ncbi:MAG: hypothetical protein WBB31_05440 [Saprospiraceae bacterium]